MKSTQPVGRPADLRNEIARELRRQIVAGALAPGCRLPTRVEIESRFSASPFTVQRALENLRADGFITVNGRQGTYVAAHPPHLGNFALVFPGDPGGASRKRFWMALGREAANYPLPAEQALRVFHNIDGARGNPAYEELLYDVLAHRVAGLIFAAAPHRLQSTPILDEPGIPRVGIQSGQADTKYPVVVPDSHSFFARAFDHLKQRGCRRVACITAPHRDGVMAQMRQLALGAGLQSPLYWWQSISPAWPEAARNCAHLLFNAGQAERPDALIIGDDHLVEHAMLGLVDAGVREPGELRIVAHCNFPYAMPCPLPCTWLGFDARAVLQACINAITAQRRGGEPPALTRIPAIFEHEATTGATGPYLIEANAAVGAIP